MIGGDGLNTTPTIPATIGGGLLPLGGDGFSTIKTATAAIPAIIGGDCFSTTIAFPASVGGDCFSTATPAAAVLA
jgi:hypothetical protein